MRSVYMCYFKAKPLSAPSHKTLTLILFLLGCPTRPRSDHLDAQNIKTLPPTQSAPQKNTPPVKPSPKDSLDISLVHRLGSTKFPSAYNSIFRLALSPDERILAAGFRNTNQVILWDTSTGQEIASLRAGEQTGDDEKHIISSLAFSPDGKYLAIGLFVTSIEIFAVETAKHVASFEGSAAAFSPSGNHLVIADTEEVFVRSFPAGELLATWPYLCAANQVLFSPDGVWVAIAGYDGVVYVWEAANGRLAHKFRGYVELTRSLAFTPDSKYVIATNRFVPSEKFRSPKNHELHLWELASDKKLRTWKDFELGYPAIEFDPSRPVFYAGSKGGVWRRGLSPNYPDREMYSHNTTINDIVFAPGQAKIYSAGDDGIVRCWDVEHDKDCLPEGHRSAVMSVAFSPDGKTIASAGMDHTIRFWDATTGKLQSTWETTERFVDELDFSPDGQFLLARGADTITMRGNPKIIVWNLATKQQHCRLAVESSDYYSSMVIAPDGTKVALCANDPRIFGFLDFWDIQSCSQVQEISNEKFNMSTICWISNETVIAMGHAETAQEKTIQFWNLSDAKKTKDIALKSTNADHIQGEACSPTGSFAATFDKKQSVLQLWDTNSGELKKTLPGPNDLYVRDLIISPNEKVAASLSHPIVVWDLETGAYKTTTTDDYPPIESITFSPDSCLLAGASSDSTIFVWKLSTPNCEQHSSNLKD